MRITGRGLIIKDGKLLLMERWRDGLHYFSIPGGAVESGETIEQAAARELYEEMSLKVQLERKLYIMKDADSEHHIFLCTFSSGQPQLHPDSPESIANTLGKNRFEPRWVPIEEVAKLPFIYWEPMRKPLAHDLLHGFAQDCKTVLA
jgi:8-oxo-dGTP diphosphatase